MPARIAAAAVVSATYPGCQADVPLVAFHGSADPLVPFEGGTSDEFPMRQFAEARRFVTEWARAACCDALPTISRPAMEIELSTFNRCPGGDGEVLLYTVLGGGHTWPGSSPLPVDLVGATTQQIDASEIIVSFFDSGAAVASVPPDESTPPEAAD
jgi:polyhydroxybutyrate depolymerase